MNSLAVETNGFQLSSVINLYMGGAHFVLITELMSLTL